MYTLAVDVGGTKIAAGVLDEQDIWLSKNEYKSDASTPENMYQSLVNSMNVAIEDATLDKNEITNIGIAIPGKVDKVNGIAVFQNNLPWRDYPLKEKIQEAFPHTQVALEHDVGAATLGEWSVRDLKEGLFVYTTISTGIASSILQNGKQISGKGLAGEVGFFPVDKTADVETTASGSAMEKEIKERFGSEVSLKEAFARWKDGDRELDTYFKEKARVLSSTVFHMIALLDPHKVVLGGGVMNKQPKFYELVVNTLKEMCHHPLQKEWASRLERSQLGGDSGLYGAAVAAKK